jgi:hypothetical protein
MILEPGNKVLVAHRRLFVEEAQRFFVAEVLEYDAGMAKLEGYSFVVDTVRGLVLRKQDSRVKVVSLQSGTLIVYQLPGDTVVDNTRFELHEAALTLTDGANLTMNMTEAPHAGQI